VLVRRRVPVLAVALFLAVLGCVLIAAGLLHQKRDAGAGASGHSGGSHGGAGAAADARPRRATRLRLASTKRLPAPVQLPALSAGAHGRVVAAGGLSAADVSVDDLLLLRPGRPRVEAHLPQAIHDAAAASVGGHTYVFGGGTASGSSAQIIRTGGGAPSVVGKLPTGSSDIEAATIAGTAYVVGGYTGTVPLRSILAYRPGGQVRLAGGLPRPLRYAAVGATKDAVLIAGGTSGTTAQRSILRFDPRSGKTRRIGQLPHALTHAGGAVVGSTFYVLGGRGASLTSQTAQIWAVDVRSGRVRRAGRLPAALSDVGATAAGGSVLVAGGRDAQGRVHDELWSLKPASVAVQARAASSAVPPPAPTNNVYAADGPNKLSATVRHDLPRVYVPNSQSNTVDVIDQRTGKVVDHFPTGGLPQHVTPSWDLKTLWVTNDTGNSLTPIDPRTGHHGRPVPVTDPYNLYFTTDGKRAIVVAEAHRQLDFRAPHTMHLTKSLPLPTCRGVDHMDFTANGRLALVSCEFAGRMVVVDLKHERAVRSIDLSAGAMPQDVKLSPDGRTFYVADMATGGVWLIDARTMRKIRFQRTGQGAHGLYPSRDARTLYVSNRGEGTISLISFRTRRPYRRWRIPGGGSPDMGGVSADGKVLWLSGRYNGEVYAISTRTGHLLHRIRVGAGPHGMAVWPQPGRYSIGHTGILR
jgi:YVTN family beta-propeller protein